MIHGKTLYQQGRLGKTTSKRSFQIEKDSKASSWSLQSLKLRMLVRLFKHVTSIEKTQSPVDDTTGLEVMHAMQITARNLLY